MILKSKGEFRTILNIDTIWYTKNNFYLHKTTNYLKTGVWLHYNKDGSKDRKVNF